MKIEISLSDYLTLLEAAEYGAKMAEGFKGDHTVRKWKEVSDRLAEVPLPSPYATSAERDAAFLDQFAADCANHGAD